MDKASIVIAIISRVESTKTKEFTIWTIGITQNPADRKKEHGNPIHWQLWKADSLAYAQKIESHFIIKMGMNGGTVGDLDPSLTTYVYIF